MYFSKVFCLLFRSTGALIELILIVEFLIELLWLSRARTSSLNFANPTEVSKFDTHN